MRNRLLVTVVTLACTVFAALPAFASTALMDYVGFGWESYGQVPDAGDLTTSSPGDVLSITAVVDELDPLFGVDLGLEEATIFITDLVSQGEVPIGGGAYMIQYTGGTMSVYQDLSNDHFWGVSPDATTFINGSLLLKGEFTEFTMYFYGAGQGAYEGRLNLVDGTAVSICNDCAYSFGGAFTYDVGAQIPEGYDIQVDGVLEVDSVVSTTENSFGAIKSLFGSN